MMSRTYFINKTKKFILIVMSQQCVLACKFQDPLRDITNKHYYFMNHNYLGKTKIVELHNQ